MTRLQRSAVQFSVRTSRFEGPVKFRASDPKISLTPRPQAPRYWGAIRQLDSNLGMGGPRRPACRFRLYWTQHEMSLLRRFLIRAAQELGHNPKARAKASQVLEEDVKPRAKQAWREAQPKIENAKLGLKLFAQRVRDEYRKGRDGK